MKPPQQFRVMRTFRAMTGSLRVMRDWLVETGVTIAAMESASTYWKSACYRLRGSCRCGC
jgi:hypothetical protein